MSPPRAANPDGNSLGLFQISGSMDSALRFRNQIHSVRYTPQNAADQYAMMKRKDSRELKKSSAAPIATPINIPVAMMT